MFWWLFFLVSLPLEEVRAVNVAVNVEITQRAFL